jgi:arylsulfatase A-like enzyme
MTIPGSDRTGRNRGPAAYRRHLAEAGRLPPEPPRHRSEKVPQHPTHGRPNVLWIQFDQLRADVFGHAKRFGIATPHIDRLVREGALCTRSYCTSPVCVTSRASQLTGLRPSRHGAIANHYPMAADPVTWPTLLRDAGWRCATIGKEHCGRSPQAIWEYHDDVMDPFGATKPSHVPFDPGNFPDLAFIDGVCDNSDLVLHGAWPGPEATTKTHQLTTLAERWLYWHDEPRPFVLRVSYGDPHPPVLPPPPWLGRHDPDTLAMAHRSGTDGASDTVRAWASFHGDDRVDEGGHRQHVARYLDLVAFCDHQVGRLLDALDRSDYAQDTLVILNADHGHMLGERGLVHKGPFFYDGVWRIPTIARWPGRIPAGRVVDDLVDGADFAATMLDALGQGVPSGWDGRSLLPALRGQAPTGRDVVCGQWDDYLFAIRDARWKLFISDADADGELYDMDADPYERDNRWHDPGCTAIRTRLLYRLRAWRQGAA